MPNKVTTYGLIGFPLGHSLSPCMHNTAFRALDVPAVYELFPLKEHEVEPFIKHLRDKDCHIFGVNVTVPYKEKVMPLLDALSPFAEKAGAVNTIVVDKNRRLTGHNTDGPGFMSHLAELGFDISGKRVSLIGAGGAARAIIAVLCLMDQRPGSVFVYDIDSEKADNLVADLGSRMDTSIVQVVRSIDDLNIEIADLLINATPVGLKSSDPVLFEKELLHPDMLVYDLIYNPRETKLLAMARERGARISNGLGMLFYQGVLAFEHWAGYEVMPAIREQMRMSLEIGEVI
ncbi:MAG: shikimate dehydrogenase [Candidatus Omnitrophota bacterium]